MTASKIALVTGAASGIGLEVAKALGAAGHRLVLLDRSASVTDIASQLRLQGVDTTSVEADLSDTEATKAAADKVIAEMGGVDILVNNAGIHPKVDGRIAKFEDIAVADWELVFRINTTAPFLLCQKLIPTMKEKRWGRIINVASRAGRAYSERAGTHYSASKAALIGMTRKLAGDFGPFGITANCIAPGQIATPLAAKFAPEVLAEAVRRIPAGRIGKPEEIAASVVYLASEGSGFVNGTVLDVNGGETMA